MRTAPAAGRAAGLRRDGRGLIYVEFLIAFPPLFLLFLCILQLALLYAANLGVQHSSFLAARAAIVIFPDDPVYYGGSEKNLLQPEEGCTETVAQRVLDGLASVGVARERHQAPEADCWGGPRLQAVRTAASLSMVPFGPKLGSVLPGSFEVPGGEITWLVGAALYGAAATAVTFPDAPGSQQLLGPGDSLGPRPTVRVTYLFHCGVPMARLLVCDRFVSLVTGRDWDIARRSSLRAMRAAADRLKASSSGMQELFLGSGHASWLMALLVSDARFRVLRAETTLPLHDAGYGYRSEHTPPNSRKSKSTKKNGKGSPR